VELDAADCHVILAVLDDRKLEGASYLEDGSLKSPTVMIENHLFYNPNF